MQITVIGVGKVKEPYLVKAVAEYSKVLGRYCSLALVEVPDVKAPESLSEKEKEQVKEAEGQGILSHLQGGTYVIALDIKGRMLTSEELAARIDKLAAQGHRHLAFIIGGSLGLSEQILQRADFRLSFSPMTFPHQLMRVILLEQLCRSFRITKGQTDPGKL